MHQRVFKTKPFAKLANKLGLADSTLCNAVREMTQGLIDAKLGGGVVKKRVASNSKGKSGGFRTLVATNFGDRWIFMYVFAKSDRSNITDTELVAFRRLAQVFVALDARSLKAALDAEELVEIGYGQS